MTERVLILDFGFQHLAGRKNAAGRPEVAGLVLSVLQC
jgi:hypothetical protein